MSKKIRHSLLTSLIFLQLFALNISPAYALFGGGGPSIPTPSEVASELENRYHLNLGSIQSFGEGFNVSEQKVSAPEVTISFVPADPRPGYEITAQAYPLFFSNGKEHLYYTWYLKHEDCDEDSDVDPDKRYCDADNDGDVDEKDWKVEAMRTLVNNGFDSNTENYATDDDSDGYEATWGGDGNSRLSEYCYVQDFTSGELYELSGGGTAIFHCPAGSTPKCVENAPVICPVGSSFINYNVCQDTLLTPTCAPQASYGTGAVYCAAGSARCVSSLPEKNPSCSDLGISGSTPCSTYGTALTSCSATPTNDINKKCQHLFPNAPGHDTGDEVFNRDEEKFWTTNPHDPDTANTGYGDEANVAGLGQDSFTWVYEVGDRIGVVVEGLSLIPTKHDDKSRAVMWAFSKNDCPVSGTSSYTKNIRGYNVKIPTTNMDLNDCLKRNLVDPREGRQASDLDVSLSYTPDTPLNDATGEDFGDTLTVRASAGNTSTRSAFLNYDWTVEISRDGSFNPRDYSGADTISGWEDITTELMDEKLLSHTQGNNITTLAMRLNITDDILSGTGLDTGNVFAGGAGYLRITAKVTESLDGEDATREDRSQVIAKIISSDTRITPYTVNIQEDGRVTRDTQSGPICSADESLERSICFIARGEIIGISMDGSDLDTFNWTLNGQSLTCNGTISTECNDTKQTSVNFFPVIGSVGDVYTATAAATSVETGERIELERTFQIIDPFIKIISTDTDIVWPIYLGRYTDSSDRVYEHYSSDVFQTYAGSDVNMATEFHPGFTEGNTNIAWTVNGYPLLSEENPTELSFTADLPVGNAYTITAEGVFKQPKEIRNAMRTLWNISDFTLPEQRLSKTIRLEIVESGEGLALTTPAGLFAAVISNASKQIVFLFQLFGSLAVIVFFMSFIFSFNRQQEN